MEWKYPTSQKTKKFKSHASAGKVMPLLFSTVMGLEHYLKQDTAVTTALYTEILKSKLKQAICNKCRSLPSKGVILLHDTLCLHYTAATIEAIGQLKF